ncbi:MAG: hypothetical protein NVSMB56_14720 [Pyrinomonadaceae bacterium]
MPLFLPRITPFRQNKTHDPQIPMKFDPNLYMRYREYRAAFGLVVALSVLAAKAFLIG